MPEVNSHNKMIVNDAGICKRKYIDDITYSNEIVISKEAFIEAYNLYIKEAEECPVEAAKADFFIATGPRQCGKTTELIKHVCRINSENGRNVAVIICSSQAEACIISRQASEMGYMDMPFPIPINALIAYARSGHLKSSFYKLGFVNDIDRVLQSLIMPLELRGFTYTLPTKEKEK